MKRLGTSLAIAALALIVPVGIAAAAPRHMGTKAVFHVSIKFMHRASFTHAMGSATLRYTRGDVFIKVTTDHLPRPSILGKRAYVVFATDGAMSDRVGALKYSGSVAGVKGEVMMTKVRDLYVYATRKVNDKRPSGTLVLSAMVG